MKKTVSVIAVLVVMLSVFFYLPVNAASAEYVSRATNVFTNNGVGVTCVAELFYPTVNTSLPAGSEQTTIICLTLNNSNDQDAFIRSLSVTLGYSTTGLNPAVASFESFTNDLYLSRLNSDGSFTVVSSTDYANSSGFVIPQHSNMTLVAAVHTVANFNTQSQTVTGVSLATVVCTISDPVLGSYEYHGNPANLSTLTHLLSEINLDVDGLPTTLNTMINVLRSIYTRQGSMQTTLNDIYNEIVNRVYPYLSNISANTNYIVSDLNQILNMMQSQQSSNISSDSGTLKDQSDSVHTQEAAYYAQNSQAIQATGLSNYQFDASAVSGLTGVRGDFIDVWNSLGGWNSVYIFSLTLGLALTILRHSPSAISSALRRRRDNNNG